MKGLCKGGISQPAGAPAAAVRIACWILGLVLAAGHLLRQISRLHWVTALCQAVPLYWLILPQGALFG